jgi:hypothetical protein
VVLAPILVMIVWLGVYPQPFLDRIEPSARALLARLDRAAATAQAEGGADRLSLVGSGAATPARPES